MENMYEIFAREHPGLFTNCRDITALMEAAYGAWCFIAPPEKCNDKDFLDAFIDDTAQASPRLKPWACLGAKNKFAQLNHFLYICGVKQNLLQ